MNPDGNETLVTVWQGRGEVTGGGDSYDVVANQQARFAGTDQLDHEVAQIPQSDDFDNWAFHRDRQDDNDSPPIHFHRNNRLPGPLNEYAGHWHYEDGYGQGLDPAGIAGDWAPYRNGHWARIAPGGWTWVEDEPWGLSFHYGRWGLRAEFLVLGARTDCMCGQFILRPSLPLSVEMGSSLSVGVDRGPGVRWFPLAPGEVYVPGITRKPRIREQH